jgi:hypothetical protein
LDQTIFPFELKNDGTLKVAFADPSPKQKIQEIQDLAKRPIEPFVAEHSEIISAIQRHYPLSKQLPSLVSRVKSGGIES